MSTKLGDWYSGAVISNDGKYRYHLWRRWTNQFDSVTWFMLNPSTANHAVDDATVRRICGFSRKWGYGAAEIVNLFALRSTDPAALLTTTNPIGPENEEYLTKMLSVKPALIVAAWGAHGNYFGRSIEMRKLFDGHTVKCLGRCTNGEPKHPVRLAYSTPLQPYIGAS